MSDAKALLVRDDRQLAITISAAGVNMRTEALELAALIGRVSNADEQQVAVNAQKALVAFRQAVEASRRLVKEPVIKFGRVIDDTARNAIAETDSEEIRITKLIADFQSLEMARVRAAQQAENERLSQIERERQQALAQAQNHDALDVVNAEFDQKAQEAQPKPVPPPPRVEGQIVKEIWEYEVLNIHQLYAHHPNLVKLEPRRAEISEALKAGLQIPGLRAWKVTKSSVRI